ncbi:hypothetical protein CPC08DRAFT_541312 [Agrocybe pediades]|nr:hypothetical protein CPC08DRAFT_541312 [Agrocybe pediades]
MRNWPISSTRHFISSTSLTGVFINEGLSGWNVLYYLAFTCKPNPQTRTSLRVAFQVRFHSQRSLSLL